MVSGTGPGEVLVEESSLEKGEETQFLIDPRGRRADPRRRGHGANWVCGLLDGAKVVPECSPCAARGWDAARAIVAMERHTRPGRRSGELEEYPSGDREIAAWSSRKLCGQKG